MSSTVVIDFSIVLSPTYQVPVLWFSFLSDVPTSSNRLETVYDIIVSPTSRQALQNIGVLGGISIAVSSILIPIRCKLMSTESSQKRCACLLYSSLQNFWSAGENPPGARRHSHRVFDALVRYYWLSGWTIYTIRCRSFLSAIEILRDRSQCAHQVWHVTRLERLHQMFSFTQRYVRGIRYDNALVA